MGVRILRGFPVGVCPLDGQPLKQAHHYRDRPSLYVHWDGTEHEDLTAESSRSVQPPTGGTLPDDHGE